MVMTTRRAKKNGSDFGLAILGDHVNRPVNDCWTTTITQNCCREARIERGNVEFNNKFDLTAETHESCVRPNNAAARRAAVTFSVSSTASSGAKSCATRSFS